MSNYHTHISERDGKYYLTVIQEYNHSNGVKSSESYEIDRSDVQALFSNAGAVLNRD